MDELFHYKFFKSLQITGYNSNLETVSTKFRVNAASVIEVEI